MGKGWAWKHFRGLSDDIQFFGTRLTADDARRMAGGTDPVALGEALALAMDERTPAQREKLRRYYLEMVDSPYRAAKAELAEASRRPKEIDAAAPPTMV